MSISRSVQKFMAVPAAALAFAMVLCWGDPASAQGAPELDKHKMSGKWLTRRGTAFIPLLAAKATTAPVGNCLGGAANPCYLISGGVAGDGIATATANGTGKQLTIPAGVFDGPPLLLVNGTKNVFGLPANPTVIQVSTMFQFSGPKADGVFKPNFASTSPNGRLSADFTWCPGAAGNPNCTSPDSAVNGGTHNGLVNYTSGANKFGGTMQQVLSGGGDLSIKVGGVTNSLSNPLQVLHNIIGGGGGTQVFGGPYASTNENALPGGNITIPGWVGCTGPGGICPGPNAANVTGTCGGPSMTTGCLIETGVVVGVGPSSTNLNFGFPFTTGMITAQVTVVAGTLPETFVTTGSDVRGIDGGNIVLVAGGITDRGSGSYFSSLEKVSITLLPVKEGVPAMAPVGIVTFTTLMALAGGFALRRRSNKKN